MLRGWGGRCIRRRIVNSDHTTGIADYYAPRRNRLDDHGEGPDAGMISDIEVTDHRASSAQFDVVAKSGPATLIAVTIDPVSDRHIVAQVTVASERAPRADHDPVRVIQAQPRTDASCGGKLDTEQQRACKPVRADDRPCHASPSRRRPLRDSEPGEDQLRLQPQRVHRPVLQHPLAKPLIRLYLDVARLSRRRRRPVDRGEEYLPTPGLAPELGAGGPGDADGSAGRGQHDAGDDRDRSAELAADKIPHQSARKRARQVGPLVVEVAILPQVR